MTRTSMLLIALFLMAVPAAAAQSSLTSVSPSSGPSGTVIILTGSGFLSGATVALTCPSGSNSTAAQFPASSVTVISTTQASATVPSGPILGSCDVTIANPKAAPSPPISLAAHVN